MYAKSKMQIISCAVATQLINPFVLTPWTVYNTSSSQIHNIEHLAFCHYTAQFASDMVGNLEEMFSRYKTNLVS